MYPLSYQILLVPAPVVRTQSLIVQHSVSYIRFALPTLPTSSALLYRSNLNLD
jgi:hypothetical protein